jgi:vacuolar-type H+-ATPase subunit C/Vma6
MNDSYSAARIHAMRTKLIKPEEYSRLLRMSAEEIVSYLHATEYREDIDALALKELEDLEVIDKVIARNAAREMDKLQRISGEEHAAVLRIALHENDIWNITVIADAITGGIDAKEALRLYAKRGAHDPLQFAGARSIEELGRLASGIFPGLAKSKTPETLPELRDLLYTESLRQHAGPLQQHFIDEENIIRLIMLKRDGLRPEEILAKLMPGGTIRQATLRKATGAATAAGALDTLRATGYAIVIEAAQAELQQGPMVHFEAELHLAVLRRIRKEAITHPLHAELLMRYLAEKELERQNIRLLIKGKRLGLGEEFIKQHLTI